MRRRFSSRLFAVVLAGHSLSAAAAQERLFQLPARNLKAEATAAAQDGKTLALLFEMKDCAPCLALKQDVFPQPAALRGFGQNYRTLNVALDGDASLRDASGQPVSAATLAERYRVQGTPAIAFLDPQGKLLYRHQGPIADAAALVELGRFVREAAYENEPLAEYRRRHAAHLKRAEPNPTVATSAAETPAGHQHTSHAAASFPPRP